MLQTDCGYTPAQIRKMTLDDVTRLCAFWRKHPPLRVLFSAVHGFKPTEDQSAPPQYMTVEDMRRLVLTTGGRIPGST